MMFTAKVWILAIAMGAGLNQATPPTMPDFHKEYPTQAACQKAAKQQEAVIAELNRLADRASPYRIATLCVEQEISKVRAY